MPDTNYKYLDSEGLLYFWSKLKAAFVGSVQYDSTNKKITQTKNGATTDIVALSTMKTAMALNNVANGAEVNQNAFSNAKVGSTTIAADTKTDTLEFVAGSNIALTPDATNDKITIAATDLVSNIRLESMTGGGYRFYKTINGTETALDITISSYSAMTQQEYNTGTDILGKLISPQLLKSIITNAIAGVTQISFQIVAELPTTGTVGVIYLISHSHGTRDIYDEYVWIGDKYEKIGNTDVDLSGYVQATQMVAITNSEIDTIVAS